MKPEGKHISPQMYFVVSVGFSQNDTATRQGIVTTQLPIMTRQVRCYARISTGKAACPEAEIDRYAYFK
jgi:hypothetical protein